jgi:hypothetical protein
MGLWAIKYTDEHQKWWVDVVLQDAPPPVAREKIGALHRHVPTLTPGSPLSDLKLTPLKQ